MKCASCNNIIECQNSLSCWCNGYPNLTILDSSENCFCSDCLILKLATEFNSKRTYSDQERHQVKQLGVPETLIEGVDFIINDTGLYTFTSWYLLRRGFCCENGCLNCPYNYKE